MTTDELDLRLHQFRDACRRAGVKITRQRLEIFRELAGATGHPDAETVFRAVQQRLPSVSLDTVYRTLWKLTDLGLVSTLGPRRDRARFDSNTAPHQHFVCVRCGLARDFQVPSFEPLGLQQALGGVGTILGTYLEARGVCASCAQREEAAG